MSGSRLPFILSMSVMVPFLTGADADLNRAVRAQEANQRTVTATTGATARDLQALADELAINRVAEVGEVEALAQASGDLAQLSNPNGERTMPWVLAKLAEARQGERGALTEASAAQTALVVELERLAKKIGTRPTGTATAAIKRLAETQEALARDTERLVDQTLGKLAEELTEGERAEADRISKQQEEVAKDITEAIDQLRKDAAAAPDSQAKEALTQAANVLEQAKADTAAAEAAKDVAANQLSSAQDKQDDVLDALSKAAEQAAQADPNAEDSYDAAMPTDPHAHLAQTAAQLAALAQRQEEVLQAAKTLDDTSSAAEFNQLQAAQANIASDLTAAARRETTAVQDAAQHAQAAQEALAQQEQNAAVAAMEATLAAIQTAQAAAEAALAQAQLAAMAAQQAAQMQALAQQQEALMAATQQTSSQAHMHALTPQQQAIKAALAQTAIPTPATQTAQQAAHEAAQALEQGQQAQAMAAMAQAIAAMQQAAAEAQAIAKGEMPMPNMPSMKSQANVLPPVTALVPSARDERRRDGQWQVSLEPTEREVLTTSASEQYPDRYHQALSDYYRALASGGAQP